jgi:hypothetical protein
MGAVFIAALALLAFDLTYIGRRKTGANELVLPTEFVVRLTVSYGGFARQ